MKKKNTLIAECTDMSFAGKGVVKTLYGVVFVDGLLPGEKAEIEILYKRAGSFFGHVVRLIEQTPNRIQPVCPVCTACGGCQFQQWSYESQLKFKHDKVVASLSRYLKKEIPVEPVIGMGDPYHYRNKIQVPLGRDAKGNIVSGFFKAGSHKIMPIDGCAIEDERASRILTAIKKLIKDFSYQTYDEDEGTGLFRHVLIRISKYRPELMVTLVTTQDNFPGKNNFVKELLKACPEITTVVQNINPRHTNVILGERERVLYGPGFIIDEILGLSFRISSKSFYQINPVQVEKLYGQAIELAGLSKDDVVFDAYCGIGTISLLAAKYVKKVIGVEIVKDAVDDAITNAKHNNVNNAMFIVNDAGQSLVELTNSGMSFDCVFMDPPRKGSDDKFLDALLEALPKKIVYVSCDPDTLARDIAVLSKRYEIQKVQPVDMFPMTYHVETVVLLQIK